MTTLSLALAGLGIGAVAALCGLGLLVTYRLTGVLNLAFGGIATLAAYVLWQAVRVWQWPVGLAAAADLAIFCPAMGLAIDRFVYRPLRRRGAGAAEHLVASVGVLVLTVGAAVALWGMQTRVDAPRVVPDGALWRRAGVVLPASTAVELGGVVFVAVAFVVVLRSAGGLVVRAVVDERDLAELNAIDTDRVTAIGWMAGAVLAGAGGILLAPTLRLDPYGLTLVVLETTAVVVAARLRSAPQAVAAALVVGVAQAELTRLHVTGMVGDVVGALRSNLFVLALLVAVLTVRQLDERQASPVDAGGIASLAARRRLVATVPWWAIVSVALPAPLLLRGDALRTALTVPALAIVLVSIVLVTGYSGQISLGQAGFAGVGALVTARLAGGRFFGIPAVPWLVALAVAPLLAVLVGLLCGWPAIRRRGLFLALTTLAFGAAASRLAFDQPVFVRGVAVHRPAGFAADGSFYVVELACLGLALLLVRNLHVHRLGRALVAVRDDELGAQACGIDLRRVKLLVFATGAALAALGGSLLSMGAQAFDAAAFDPLRSLLWFSAVVVFGVDSAAGAVLAAALLVAFDELAPAGSSVVAIGVAAVLVGHLPGGVLHGVDRALAALRAGGRDREVATPPPRRLTVRGRRLLEARVTAPRGDAR